MDISASHAKPISNGVASLENQAELDNYFTSSPRCIRIATAARDYINILHATIHGEIDNNSYKA
jgi:hypothetical protein